MNVMILVLLGSVFLLGFGFLVDLLYKRRGITTDPIENEKHVSTSERVYVESYLDQVKDQNNNSGW